MIEISQEGVIKTSYGNRYFEECVLLEGAIFGTVQSSDTLEKVKRSVVYCLVKQGRVLAAIRGHEGKVQKFSDYTLSPEFSIAAGFTVSDFQNRGLNNLLKRFIHRRYSTIYTITSTSTSSTSMPIINKQFGYKLFRKHEWFFEDWYGGISSYWWYEG